MKRAGIFISILLFWFVFCVVFLFSVVLLGPSLNRGLGINLLVASSSQNTFEPLAIASSSKVTPIVAAAKGGDSRIVLVDRFLTKYHSPMTGLGKEFVAAADKNGLDWRLLPAIAFQESNLGRVMPRSSYNPFGWAIYAGKNSGVYFQNWEHSINTVASEIRKDYLDKGLTTPETIVLKYTSRSSPSWVFAVKSAMEEISDIEY